MTHVEKQPAGSHQTSTSEARMVEPPMPDEAMGDIGHHQGKHHGTQLRNWIVPLRIDSASLDLDRLLEFYNFEKEFVKRQVKTLTPDDCRLFCWKDCAIYVNRGNDRFETSGVTQIVYEEWFPHRARDQDIRNDSYFAKVLRFTPPAEKLEDIKNFHSTLCEKLKELEGDVLEREYLWPHRLVPEEHRRPGQFKLRPTFFEVFIVVEGDWKTHGVLLFLKDSDTAEKHVGNLDEDGEAIQKYENTDGSDLGEICIFRCSWKRAMKAVVSQDPERAKKNKEYCWAFQEWYGSDDEEK